MFLTPFFVKALLGRVLDNKLCHYNYEGGNRLDLQVSFLVNDKFLAHAALRNLDKCCISFHFHFILQIRPEAGGHTIEP